MTIASVGDPCPWRDWGANGIALLTRVCSPDPVTDMHTERLILRPIDTDEAERIVARQPGTQDSWARDFPFDGDVIGVSMFLRATAAHGDQYPFGHYVVIRGPQTGKRSVESDSRASRTMEQSRSATGSPHRPVGMATPPRPRGHSSHSLGSRGCRASSPTRTKTTPPPSGPSSTRVSRRPARTRISSCTSSISDIHNLTSTRAPAAATRTSAYRQGRIVSGAEIAAARVPARGTSMSWGADRRRGSAPDGRGRPVGRPVTGRLPGWDRCAGGSALAAHPPTSPPRDLTPCSLNPALVWHSRS